jgi:hypothetical protein
VHLEVPVGVVARRREQQVVGVVADQQRPFGLARGLPVRDLDGVGLADVDGREWVESGHSAGGGHAQCGELVDVVLDLVGVTAGVPAVQGVADNHLAFAVRELQPDEPGEGRDLGLRRVVLDRAHQ